MAEAHWDNPDASESEEEVVIEPETDGLTLIEDETTDVVENEPESENV